MAAWSHQFRRGTARETGADGDAVPEPLGEGHDVRQDPIVLMGEPAARAAEAGLDLVQHHQPTVRVTDPPDTREVAGTGHDDPTFALHRLHENRHHVLALARNPLEGLEVVVRNPQEALDQRLETRLHLAVRRRAEGGEGAAVEAAFHDDDHRDVHLEAVPVQAGKLDRRLVRLCTGIAEECPAHPRDPPERVRQLFLGGDPVQVRGVHEAARLVAEGLRHRRVGVTETAHRDASDGIEVPASLLVPQPDAFPPIEGDRLAGVRPHQGICHHARPERKEATRGWRPACPQPAKFFATKSQFTSPQKDSTYFARALR